VSKDSNDYVAPKKLGKGVKQDKLTKEEVAEKLKPLTDKEKKGNK
jgi:hypothetical protein